MRRACRAAKSSVDFAVFREVSEKAWRFGDNYKIEEGDK
jgi:hypothetical protein